MHYLTMADQPILHTNGDLIYTVLTPEKEKQAWEVVAESFCDEPTSVHLEPNRAMRLPQWTKFTSFFATECASNGESIVCIDKSCNEVAGVFWCRDFVKPPPDDFDLNTMPGIAPTVEILMKLDENYNSLRPGLQVGECVDLWMVGVSPKYRRRGIAQMLTKVAIEWVSTKGYKYIILESSGGYSAAIAAGAGMKEVCRLTYADENDIYTGLPSEHAVMRMWEVEVQK